MQHILDSVFIARTQNKCIFFTLANIGPMVEWLTRNLFKNVNKQAQVRISSGALIYFLNSTNRK